jgi:hypothetical protein
MLVSGGQTYRRRKDLLINILWEDVIAWEAQSRACQYECVYIIELRTREH